MTSAVKFLSRVCRRGQSRWRMAANNADSNLLCAFGVIADVHYADIADGTNYTRTARRYYRRSLDLVKTAVRNVTY